jgi:hypothetical protein
MSTLSNAEKRPDRQGKNPSLEDENRQGACRVILAVTPVGAKNLHNNLDAAVRPRHFDLNALAGTALLSRLGQIAISISTAAGFGVRAATSALTTTGGMTITGPSRAGTG